MGKYKFDGKYLKHNGKTIANVSGDKIREGIGSKVVANIRDDKVREKIGSKVLINLRGTDVRLGSGSSKIAAMKDIEKAIDGNGGVTLAALWYCFVR